MIIRDQMPEVGLVILSAHVAVEHAMRLLASGRAIGYLLKTRVSDVSDFLDALGRIAGGACVIEPTPGLWHTSWRASHERVPRTQKNAGRKPRRVAKR
jgi:hypothetical protein